MSDKPVSANPALNIAALSDAVADDPWLRLSRRPCRHLMCKEMFYDTGVPLEERMGSGIFWCDQTQKCLGPDNIAVGAEDCGPSRTCYER
jgi:hypothetical protein